MFAIKRQDGTTKMVNHWGAWEMDTDDLEPEKKVEKPTDLEIMSIEALGEYIADLEAEIARARAQIAEKEKARLGAESVFRK